MYGSELVAVLERGDVPAVSIFAGEEAWFGEEGIRTARLAFLGEEEEEGYLSFQGPRSSKDREGTPLGHALDEGRTVPMFGGRKVVAWRGMTLEEDDLAALAAVAASSPAFARFVILLPSKLGVGAKKKLEKAGARVGDCLRLFDTAWTGKPEYVTPLNQWTAERARRHHLRMPLPVAHILTTAVGNDLSGIDAALAKLELGGVPGREITEDDLGSLLGQGREYDGFAFGEAVYARNAAKAYRIARNAFREGTTDQKGHRSLRAEVVVVRLFWSVGWQLDRVYQAQLAMLEGRNKDQAVAFLARGGKGNPALARSVEYARGFSRAELLRHLVILARAEAELRTAVPEEVVIDRLIAALTGEHDG